jgi:hypothetical protein
LIDRHHFREPEVEDLRGAVARQDDVGGFQIAVDDVGGVRDRKPCGHLTQDTRDVPQWYRPPCERFAFVVRHRDERLPVPFADLVNGRDVRVIERAGRLRLTAEPDPSGLVGDNTWRQELKGDLAVQGLVFSQVDDAHPARTELLKDAVVRDSTAYRPLDSHQYGAEILEKARENLGAGYSSKSMRKARAVARLAAVQPVE